MARQFKIIGDDGEEIVVSEPVVNFLIGLNDDGVKRLKDTVEFVQTVKTLSKVARWAVVGFLAFGTATLAFWNALKAAIWPGAH